LTSQSRPDRGEQPRGLPLEIGLAWFLPLVVMCEVFVTYARLPARELYHVSGSGLVGGASRALVFANFPVGLIGLAVVALLFERVRGWVGSSSILLAATLCSAVFWPGVVSQGDLDARPVNALAALGVALALVLTLGIALRHGITRSGWHRSDWGRLVVALALLVVAASWVAADLGFFLNGVPVLGEMFQTGAFRHPLPGPLPFPPAVHHGHHHGMDGFLLVVSALVLSRAVTSVRSGALRWTLYGYLSLMFCYGLGNIANDFWTEQVFKRGWSSWQMPNVLEPSLTVAWAIMLVAAAGLAVLAARKQRAP